MRNRHWRYRNAAGILVLAVLAVSGCGSDDGRQTTAGSSGGPADGNGETDISGQTVEVIYGFSAEEDAIFKQILEEWGTANGVEIKTESTSGQPQLVDIRVESGNPPDIAVFPNPSRLQGFYDAGDLVGIDDIIDRDATEESMIDGLLELGEVDDGTLVGLPYRLSVKSLVWTPPQFAEAGYEVPETWDDLMALNEQIAAGGTAPWCIGIESGGATGWPATDWLEEIMLRTAGPEVYDQWVNHEIPFNSPEVIAAGELFADLAFTDGYVRGGRQSMVTTSFGDAPEGLFGDPPKCYMHKQGNFITSFFPEDVQADLASEVGLFPFPDIDPAYSDWVMGAGDYAALFTDNPAAAELMEHLATVESGEAWAEAGGFLSPHSTIDTAIYPDPTTEQIGQQLADANGFRFDASDLMVTEIGAGVYWTEMTAWVNGDIDLETALTNVEEAWVALEE